MINASFRVLEISLLSERVSPKPPHVIYYVEEDDTYYVWDTPLNSWKNFNSAIQSLQDVVNVSNGISNYGGIGNASIQSTNFVNNRTLYLNNDAQPTIAIVDNLNSANNLIIDLNTLTLDNVSYNWADIISQGTVTSVTATTPLSSTGGATPNISIQQASASQDGYLSSTDWSTFNTKQDSITAGTIGQYYRGDKTWQTLNTTAVSEGTNLYFTNTRTIGSTLTGLSVTGGTITSADSVLSAFGKLQNQVNAVASPMIYQGTWNASTNFPTLVSSTGTKGYVYRVTTSGSTNIDGTTDWKSGDFIVYNGTTWDKWDSTDAVTSVNGYTGTVTLVKADVGLSNVENTALSTWAGSSNITTVGTIGSGIWQGSAIGNSYISSASTWNAKIGGSGTTNYLSKFTASGTIGDSSFFDNGTQQGINSPTNPGVQISGETTFSTGLLFNNRHTGTANTAAIVGNSSGINTGADNTGVKGNASGNPTKNVGLSGVATGVSVDNIGLFTYVTGGTNNYGAQFQDGTQAAGRFLKSITSDGKANWANITSSDISGISGIYVPYTGATANVNIGTNSIIADNGIYNTEMSSSYFGVQNTASTIFSLLEYNKLTVTDNTLPSAMEVNATGLRFPNGSIQTTAATGTVTSVSALTLGTTGTDVNSSVATGTTTPVITLNIPTASATNRGALSSANWSTFNSKVDGSGTINYLSKFTAAGTLGDSAVFESGGNVGIGTATPTKKLEVSADILVNSINIGKGTGTGVQNVGVGTGTLQLNTTGLGNVAIGYQSLLANTSGSGNVVIGNNAAKANTLGSQNVIIGNNAFRTAINARYNVAIGVQAMDSNTVGEQNTAVGWGVLGMNTTGYYNTAIGYQAMYLATTASYNTGIGQYALSGISIGGENIAFGYAAGSIGPGGTNTSGTKSVYLGAYTESLGTADVNSIVIGYQARSKGSNTTVIGKEGLTTDTWLAGYLHVNSAYKLPNADGTNGQILQTDGAGNATWQNSSASTGTVTSVGLSMPSAFTVSNSPITSSGTIAVTGSGTTSDYIRGDGSLATFPTALPTANVKHSVKYAEALTKGQAVYVSGADGTNMLVSKASNSTEATSSKTLGLVTATGAANYQGEVITEGLLAGLDTSTATAGDAVWLGTNGNLIFWHYGLTTKPVAPAHLVFIGIVTRVNVNNGEIFVKPQNGFEIDELHDVSVVGRANNTLLGYNSSTSLHEFKTVSTWLGYTPANIAGDTFTGAISATNLSGTNTGDETTATIKTKLGAATSSADGYLTSANWTTFNNKIGGSGTTNYLSKFTASDTIGNSQIQDDGTTLAIGATPASNTQFKVSTTASNYAVTADTYYTGIGAAYAFYGFIGGVRSDINISVRGEASNSTSANYGAYFIGTSTGSAASAGINVLSTTNGTGLSIGIIANATGTTTNKYAAQLQDGTEGTGKFLKSTDSLGRANWATLTSSDVSGVIAGSGTANYLSKFTASGTIGNSLIQDDGTKIGINSAPVVGSKIYIISDQTAGINLNSNVSNINTAVGIDLSVSGTNNSANTGIVSNALNGNFTTTGVQGSASSSTGVNKGIEGIASGTSTNIGLRGYAVNGSSNYSIQLQDGTQTVAGRFLKNMDANGRANWATLTVADTGLTLTTTGSSGSASLVSNTLNVPTYTLAGLGGVGGSGTANYISKFTASGTIGNSLIQDNGTNLGISTAPVAGTKVTIQGSTGHGLRANTTGDGKYGLYGSNVNDGPGTFVGVYGEALDNGGRFVNTTWVGGKFFATNGVDQDGVYSLWLQDGTESIGRFLKSITADGRANWATLTEADISGFGTYAKVGTYTNNYVTKWNATTNTLANSLIQDNGTTLAIGAAPSSLFMLGVTSSASVFYGVYGKSTQLNGFGGYFAGTNGVKGEANGNGATTTSRGGEFNASDSVTNIGILGAAGTNLYSAVTNIGGQFVALDATNNYAVQLIDGSEGLGRFLKDVTGNGNANWATMSVADTGLTLTTTGTSGASTLVGNTLNIPQYTGSSSFIPNFKADETYRGISLNNNSTTVVSEGGVVMSSSASTLAQSVSSTNFATKQIRLRYYASVVSGGRYTGTRGSALLWYIHGGFRFVCDFNISDTSYSAGCQQFYGMSGVTTDLNYGSTSNILVSTLLNIVGVGSEVGDTNLQIFHNDGSGTATKVDLGVGFPANRTAGAISTTVYSIQLYNEPNSTTVEYEVINKETGAIVQGSVSTNLPLTSQGLNFFASRCMSITSVTNTGQFDLNKLGVYSI